MNSKPTATTSRWARIGLWGSVTAIILASLFYYLSPYRFYPSQYTARWTLIACTLLTVLAISTTLLTIRRRIPTLRQDDNLDTKLNGYAQHTRSIYGSLLAVVVILCLGMIFTNQNILLMLAIVTTLVLFLNYPNIYRIKTDLGLTDNEMQLLYGDRYIHGHDNNQ